MLDAGGVSLELAPAALRQSRALIRWPLRSSAHPEGNPQADIHTGHCCARPSLRSARRLRPGGVGRAQRWPVWLFGCPAFGLPPLLAAPAAGRLRGGMGAFARMLRYLTRRVCPNAAAQQRSELCGAPRKRPAAGLPRSNAKGSQTAGSPFFCLLFFGEAKKSESRAGAKPGLRPQTEHIINYENNSYYRLIHKRQHPKTPKPNITPAQSRPDTPAPPSGEKPSAYAPRLPPTGCPPPPTSPCQREKRCCRSSNTSR